MSTSPQRFARKNDPRTMWSVPDVEAMQWTEYNTEYVIAWIRSDGTSAEYVDNCSCHSKHIVIHGRADSYSRYAILGDYIVLFSGGMWPVDESSFLHEYEPVKENEDSVEESESAAEPRPGDIRWHSHNPDQFVVRAWSRNFPVGSPCWLSCWGTVTHPLVVADMYTRSTSAEAIPLGEQRWHNTDPNLFVTREWLSITGESLCWRDCLGTPRGRDVVERDYTRSEPAPVEAEDDLDYEHSYE